MGSSPLPGISKGKGGTSGRKKASFCHSVLPHRSATEKKCESARSGLSTGERKKRHWPGEETLPQASKKTPPLIAAVEVEKVRGGVNVISLSFQ